MTGRLAEYLAQSLQLALGTVFLVAAGAKLRRPTEFVAAVRGYGLIPAALSRAVAAGLIVAESLVAVSLLTGQALAVGVPAAGALLLVFAVAVSLNLKRGRPVSCGCFGSAEERISARTLVRIGLLLAGTLALAALRFGSQPAAIDVVDSVRQGIAGAERLLAVAALSAVQFLAASCLYHLPELRELLRRLPSQV